MINSKNFKSLLKPLTLSKIIVAVMVLSVSFYYLFYSTVDNCNLSPFRYLGSIQQSLLSVMFVLIGVEELKKQNGNRFNSYLSFVVSFIITLANILNYFRH